MLKNLVMLAALIFIAIGVSGQPNKTPNLRQQDAKPGQTAMHSPDSQNKQSSGQADQTKAGSNTPTGNTPIERSHWWFKSEWWLVIIAALTGGVIGWQSWETRKAAKAALLNAKALVDSERPWLIAEVVRNSRNYHLFELRITNFGRTPARFIQGDATHVFAQHPETLPIPPKYSSPIILPRNLVVAPDKGFPIPHGYNIPHLLKTAGGAEKILVIYGRVIYEDTIIPGIEHEVAWCFGYMYASRNGLTTEDNFVLTGPSEYTKNT